MLYSYAAAPDDIEATRMSLKPIVNKKSQHKSKANKNLFSINEDEEEEPFSASKNNYSDIQIDDTNTKM